MADRVGQQLGNYRLTRLLGRGGFAEVYLGEHLRLNTQAAIKVLHTQIADEDVDDFQREAQIVAALVHPHIVRVLDFDVKDGVPFLVMDYAPDGSLRRLHPKGSLVSLPTIVSYVKQVADALQYAHEQKLIHRDVKPENMLIGRRNEVLLSDFGIATITQSSHYQHTQEVVGTVAYMAPEQVKGKPRPASDQYSLGIVVYEWLCGVRPFHGSFTEIATQHVFAPPPSLRERVSAISPEVEQVVLKALAKDPKQRFESVLAFASALEQVSQEKQASPSILSSATTAQNLTSHTTKAIRQVGHSQKSPELVTPPNQSSGASEMSTPTSRPSLPIKRYASIGGSIVVALIIIGVGVTYGAIPRNWFPVLYVSLTILAAFTLIVSIAQFTRRYGLIGRIVVLVLSTIGIIYAAFYNFQIDILLASLITLAAYALAVRITQLTTRYRLLGGVVVLVLLIIGLILAAIFHLLLDLLFDSLIMLATFTLIVRTIQLAKRPVKRYALIGVTIVMLLLIIGSSFVAIVSGWYAGLYLLPVILAITTLIVMNAERTKRYEFIGGTVILLLLIIGFLAGFVSLIILIAFTLIVTTGQLPSMTTSALPVGQSTK